MIQYVFGQKSEYFEKYDDPSWDEEDDDFMLSAFEQTWDEATIKQLRDEYNIIFNCGVHPILVLGKGSDHPLLVVGSEDDGTILFRRRYGQFENCFFSVLGGSVDRKSSGSSRILWILWSEDEITPTMGASS